MLCTPTLAYPIAICFFLFLFTSCCLGVKNCVHLISIMNQIHHLQAQLFLCACSNSKHQSKELKMFAAHSAKRSWHAKCAALQRHLLVPSLLCRRWCWFFAGSWVRPKRLRISTKFCCKKEFLWGQSISRGPLASQIWKCQWTWYYWYWMRKKTATTGTAGSG